MSDTHGTSRADRITLGFEAVVVAALRVLLIAVITIAVGELFYLLSLWLPNRIATIDGVPMLQEGLQRAFGGVLMVILGLELLETLRNYKATHHLRLQVIFLVALIAIGRHIMVLDVEHMDGLRLLGVAALVVALTGGYYFIGLQKRSAARGEAERSAPSDA